MVEYLSLLIQIFQLPQQVCKEVYPLLLLASGDQLTYHLPLLASEGQLTYHLRLQDLVESQHLHKFHSPKITVTSLLI